MLLRIPSLLSPEAVRQAREALLDAPWGAGRVTAGAQAAIAKNNEQLPEDCDASRLVQQLVLKGLQSNSIFFSAALPKHISPPLTNRYGGEYNTFGDHVDGAVRRTENGGRVRTDISCTVFLSDPDEYEGGNLVIQDTYGNQQVKLLAGDIVLYPGTSVHRVEPVTKGYRIGAFFWVQSMVRSDEQRRLLFDMDTHLMQLRADVGETSPPVIGLTGIYHNLLRQWLDV